MNSYITLGLSIIKKFCGYGYGSGYDDFYGNFIIILYELFFIIINYRVRKKISGGSVYGYE